jgi:hypothetical protein
MSVWADPAQAQTEAVWLFADVSFPAQVDAFLAVRIQRWPEPGRGMVVHYESVLEPDATFDVYVQPMPQGSDESAAVREELRRTLDELTRYRAEGAATASVLVDTVHAVSVETDETTYAGHMVEATIRVGSTTGRTLAYVFAKPPSFVKFRITHEPSQRAALDPRIPPFLSGVLGHLESFQDPLPPGGP